MKRSMRVKTSEEEDEVDRISNLPDHVLQLILSRIPSTEEVTRTSILSRRWRFLWTSVPFIDIDFTRRDQLDIDGLKEFVYWVFLNKPLDLDWFRLWCADCYNMSTIRRWIHAAVVRKVKLLDLMFCPIDKSEDIEVPHCLATCGSLEVLRLCLLGCPLNLPKFTGFPALRVLELNDVELEKSNLVKYFLESCLLLEDLSLIDCKANSLVISCPKLKNLRIHTRRRVTSEEFINKDLDIDWKMCLSLEISCPKLVSIKLTGHVAMEFLFNDLNSLKKAVIHAEDLFTDEEPDYDLFHDMRHVESLSISLYCVGQCYYPSIDDPISLPNLKTLELTVDALHMLIPFLTCLPDLESLHLIFPKNVYGLDKWNVEEAETINLLTRCLKKVEFLDFNEEKSKLVVARALLEHGNELEEMVFSWSDEARFHERSMESINQVSKYHKASSIVKLRCVNSVINPRQPYLWLVPKIPEIDSI